MHTEQDIPREPLIIHHTHIANATVQKDVRCRRRPCSPLLLPASLSSQAMILVRLLQEHNRNCTCSSYGNFTTSDWCYASRSRGPPTTSILFSIRTKRTCSLSVSVCVQMNCSAISSVGEKAMDTWSSQHCYCASNDLCKVYSSILHLSYFLLSTHVSCQSFSQTKWKPPAYVNILQDST